LFVCYVHVVELGDERVCESVVDSRPIDVPDQVREASDDADVLDVVKARADLARVRKLDVLRDKLHPVTVHVEPRKPVGGARVAASVVSRAVGT